MQQYRVNYSLLIGLVVGTFVCSGAAYGLWRFQIERKSGWLISEADKAAAEKDYKSAVQFYGEYLSIHPEDREARLKFANANLDLTDQDTATSDDFNFASQMVEITLRNPKMAEVAETPALRRRLVNLYGRVGNYNGALDHLKFLLEKDSNNPELQVLQATYLARSENVEEAIKYSYKLVGFDTKTEKFDLKKATAPHSTEAYLTLAELLRAKKKPELADRVAMRLVEVNPNDAAAYVGRSRLRRASDPAGARADAQKAYQLKPNDIDVLLNIAELAALDKDLDKAREYVAAAKKANPKNSRVYFFSAQLELQRGKLDKALAEYDEGAKAIGGAAGTNLLFFKARLQIDQNDVKGARQTIDDMQQGRKLNPEINEYFDAMLLYADGKWFQASEALSKLRPRLAGRREMADIGAEVDFKLAYCYEKLGRFELAQQNYQQLVDQNPDHGPAVAGVQRMKQLRGLTKSGDRSNDPLQRIIADELKKPKDQQNWEKVDAAVNDVLKNRPVDETAVKLVKAQIAMAHEDFALANKYLNEANQLSPDNLRIWRSKIQLAAVDPKVGPAKAMELLAKVVQKFGDRPEVRVDKADLLIAMNKDKQDKEPLKRELASLMTGIDSWTPQQKSDFWINMQARYASLGMVDEARQYLALAADSQPNDLPLRTQLFLMALGADDEEGMKAAQDKILQVVHDKNDSAWLYAEARRRLWQLQRERGEVNKQSLAEIRGLVTTALAQRPDWHELHALLGDIDLMLNNQAAALKHYDRAEDLGRPPIFAITRHIRLLVAHGRFNDAGKLLDRIPEQARQTLLGNAYTEILFQTKQVDAAIKQAKAAAEADPTNPQSQYWYSQLLARSAQGEGESQRKETMNLAIAAMLRATQLQPESPEPWFALIRYYLVQKDEDSAQKTMREAQLSLTSDTLPMFLARSYELLHRPFDAETMYREIYETDPNDIERAQQLAAFYMGPLYQRDDRQAKVSPLLNQILKAGTDGKVPPNDANLLWARRQAAMLYASTRDYQSLLKAEKLLCSNSQDGSLLIEDKLALAEILASRPEPASRVKATQLLEEVSRVQQLSEPAEIQLAELYSNDWPKYEGEITTVLAHYPNSVRAHETYARRLIARNDERSTAKAVDQVSTMQKLAPDYPVTIELTAKLASKLGKQQQLLAKLRSRVPDFQTIKEFTDAEKQSLVRLANLLVELNDVDTAEKIYRELAARDPKMVFDLAMFLGLHRAPEQCFDKLNEVYSKDRVPDILGVAMQVARDRRDKVGDKFDPQIQRWLDAGLRENPDSISLLVVQADLYDLQKKYEDAANVYRKLLERQDLVGPRRAVVLNNLAFLIALAGKSAATDVDPLKRVQEAKEILGPNSDILDTRAVVFISRGEYKLAIQDLELSVMDSPTPAKYFHKAVAHLRAGENRAAVEAWQKAEGLGLSRESLNRLEYNLYEQVKGEIDKIRRPSVTRTEPLRKAG